MPVRLGENLLLNKFDYETINSDSIIKVAKYFKRKNDLISKDHLVNFLLILNRKILVNF
jgi:hypothetical protein